MLMKLAKSRGAYDNVESTLHGVNSRGILPFDSFFPCDFLMAQTLPFFIHAEFMHVPLLVSPLASRCRA